LGDLKRLIGHPKPPGSRPKTDLKFNRMVITIRKNWLLCV